MSVLGDFAKRLKKSLIDPLDADKQQQGFQWRTPQQRQVATQRQGQAMNYVRGVNQRAANIPQAIRQNPQQFNIFNQFNPANTRSVVQPVRNLAQQTAAKQVTLPRFMKPVISTTNRAAMAPKKFLEGVTEGATFGLIDVPNQPSASKFDKLAYGLGYGLGMLKSPVGKTGVFNKLDKVGKAGVARILPKATSKGGQLLSKGSLALGGELAQSLGYAGAAAAAGKAGLRKDYELTAKNIGMDVVAGLGMRGLLRGKGKNIDDILKRGEALGIKGVSPRVNKVHPEDMEVMREFADRILRMGEDKKNLGELGVSAQYIAEHYFGGKWKDASNKKLAQAFEWAIDLNENIPRSERGKLPSINLVGDVDEPSVMAGIKKLGFQAPYKRGDIKQLEARLDELLGTDQFVTSNKWQAKGAARQNAKNTMRQYAQTDPEAAKYLAEAEDIENQIANAVEAKNQPTKGVEATQKIKIASSQSQPGIPGNQTLANQSLAASGRATNQVPLKVVGQKTPEPLERLTLKSQSPLEINNKRLKVQQSPQSGTVSVEASNSIITPQQALKDFREWEKSLVNQEGLLTPKKYQQYQARQATKLADQAASAIKANTAPEFVKPEKVATYRDISNSGKGMTDVYRNVDRVFGKDSQVRKQLLEPFDDAKASLVDDLDSLANDLETNIVKKYGFNKGSKESAAVQKFGEGLTDQATLVKQFGEKKAGQIVEADKWFRSQYDRLLNEVNAVRAKIYPNNPDMQIPRRKDYYRHFQDLSSTFGGLKNLFESSSGIDPALAGTSEYVKPKSKWLAFAQERLGNKTEYDAVGGFIEYAKAQSYAKRIDPFISKFRTLREELVQATSDKTNPNYGKLNNFIEFLDDYANDLAGKTNPMDRAMQKYVGRKPFMVLNWINSRTKANMIVGNLSSSIAQFFNIPQGVAEAGVRNSSKGLIRTAGSVLDHTGPMSQSKFIKTRYGNSMFDRFDVGMMNNAEKAAGWITGMGDEIGTKFIWNSLYEKALQTKVADPIRYADDMTRKMVAGRGVGEVPLLQKSKTFQLVAPFQLEVANVWHVMKDWAGEKAANKFVTFFVASYLMNEVAKKIRGSDVSFDPINAGIDALETYQDEDDKTRGAFLAGGRLLGEVLSNVPFGQTAAAMYPEYGKTIGETKLPTREQFFGEGDPTRFGGGLLASKGLSDPLFNLVPKFGGAQLKKLITGTQAVNRGYSETPTGKVRFPIEKSAGNFIKAGAFGQYAVPEAREYFDNDGQPLSEAQSALFKQSGDRQGLFNQIITNRSNTKALDKAREQVKAGQSAQQVGQSVVYYDPDSGETRTINYGKFTQPAPKGAVEAIRYEEDKFDTALKVFRADIPETQKDTILKQINASKEDLEYYDIAADSHEVRKAATYELLAAQSENDMIETLATLRKEVGGKKILTDTVIDDLYNEDVISAAEKKYLKSLDWDKKTGKAKVKKGKSRKFKIGAAPKLTTPSLKLVAPKAQSFKLTAPKIKGVQLPTKALRLQAADPTKLMTQALKVKAKPITVEPIRVRG